MDGHFDEVNDSALLKAIRDRHIDALNGLMNRYIDLVSLTAYRILCDHMESVDVVKKVFVSLWKDCRCKDVKDVRNFLLRRTAKASRKVLLWDKIRVFFGSSENLFVQSAPRVNDVDDYVTTQAWEVFCRSSLSMNWSQRIIYVLREINCLPDNVIEYITGFGRIYIRELYDHSRKKVRGELNKFGKDTEYDRYVGFLRNVRDGQMDYERLKGEILYICRKMQ